MDIANVSQQLNAVISGITSFGAAIEVLVLLAAIVLAAVALVPGLAPYRRGALLGMAVVLGLGELLLIWFHWQLYNVAVVIDPSSGAVVQRVAVPLWIESEKLYVWALIVAVLGVLMRRQRDDLLPGTMVLTAILAAGAAVWGHPFSQPLPSFLGQYTGYLEAMASGFPFAAQGAFEGMMGSTLYYYNTWYMWIHPPLLFFAYGCFAISFVATIKMIRARHSSFETTAYRWARLGYLTLTAGMLLGFPWAILAWQGESWWWSGKVNMSIMLWLLYTAYLHARLYLRRRGMWKLVAFLAILSFAILILTYLTTYIVPGAHSYAP